MALGAAIACPGRRVIALQADGSAMYTVSALWSMAREQADVVVIILKNDAYATLGLEMARVREGALNARMHAMLELGRPSLDWVSIATGMGVPAERASTAEGFHAALAAALAAPGPHLIECPIGPPDGWQALEERIYRER
jgi:acetolactate synthase-1/2/3 large subunit